MKIRPVGAELVKADRRTDGQTDSMTKLIVAFSQFCDRAQECATSAVEMCAIQKLVRLHEAAHIPRTFLLEQSAFFRDVIPEMTVRRRQVNSQNSHGKMAPTTSYAIPDTNI